MRSLFALVFVFLTFLAVSYASPYNKYGRTCKDILCTVREECVMQRDECTGYSDKCGTYPTCKRKPGVGKTGCAAMRCPTGHFCSIRQENCDKPPCQIKPTCIAFRTPSPNRAANIPVDIEPDILEATPSLPTPPPPPEVIEPISVKEMRTSRQKSCPTCSSVTLYNRPVQSPNRYSYSSPYNRNSWSFDRISGR